MIKAFIGDKFLDFLTSFVSLKRVVIASLGGKGEEAEVWKDRGLKKENGWLIERKRKLSRALIAKRGYSYHNEMSTFPVFFSNINGPNAGIDAFHLDFCGTAEVRQSELGIGINLVKKSSGRCIAITVADARRNLSLENWQCVRRVAEKNPGRQKTSEFAHALIEQQKLIPTAAQRDKKLPSFIQPANPLKCARRELGLFTVLFKAFELDHLSVDRIERYVQISRYSGRATRMRTYFFHLTENIPANPAASFAELWQNSPLTFLRDDRKTVQELEIPTKRKEGIKTPMMPTKTPGAENPSTPAQRLTKLAEAAGPEVVEYLVSVTERATFFDTLRSSIMTREGKHIPSEPASQNTKEPKPAVSNPPAGSKKLDKLGDVAKLELQIRMVNAKSQGDEKLRGLLDELVAKYGEGSRSKVRTLCSVTAGGHRPRFIARLLKFLPNEKLLEPLAAAYSKIDGKTITVDQLKREAPKPAEKS